MNLKNKLYKEKGITLIALIVTIIVLLILAGMSISMLLGDNGILNKAIKARNKSEISSIEELATLEYAAIYSNDITKSQEEIMNGVMLKLNEEGYTVVPETAENSNEITGFTISEENIVLVPNSENGEKTKDIIVSLTRAGDNDLVSSYLITINGAEHRMTYKNGKVEIEDEPIKTGDESQSYELKITPTDLVASNSVNIKINGENIVEEKIVSIKNSVRINITSNDIEGASIIKFLIQDFELEKECTIRVLSENHVCFNESVVGKQLCACGNIKYIDVESRNASRGIEYDSENKTIKINATYQVDSGYYRIVTLSGGQYWNRNYVGYEIYVPNTITSIGRRWLCDWGDTANVHYDGTREEWNAIEKNSDWCGLMFARIFFKDGDIICNSHSYGEYVVTEEPTNTTNGSRYKECIYCGYRTVESIDKFEQNSKRFSGVTVIDNTEKTITILPTYEYDGVTYVITELASGQFWTRNYVGYEIYVPNTITSIGRRWLCDWGDTANVHYDGTREEWNAIEKNSDWCGLMLARIFFKDGDIICNSHSYGEYVVTEEPTNTTNGSKYKECTYCGYRTVESIDKFEQNSKRFSGATVKDDNAKTITILPTYEYNGVTYIIVELASTQFTSSTYVGYNIYVPNTIKTISSRWIRNWGATANVYYDGTMEQWNAIEKSSDWCSLMTANIHCSDGCLDNRGNTIECTIHQ